jgi:radical SAM protein with 4Fe4S-binding SPASM domain
MDVRSLDPTTEYAMAPGVRLVAADDGYIIMDPEDGVWVKLLQPAGAVLERVLDTNIEQVIDVVGREYGGDTLCELVELLEELRAEGLLIRTKLVTRRTRDKASGTRCRRPRTDTQRVFLVVTDRCNLECSTCYREAGRDDAPTWQVERTISRAANLHLGEMTITGGEPALRRDLPDLLYAAQGAVLDVTLATNGTLITPELADAIAEIGVRVQVSLESPDEGEHDLIRGQGSFKAACRGLELLAEAGVSGIEVVSTLLDPAAFSPDDMIAFAAQYGATFHSSLFQEVGRGGCGVRRPAADPASLARSMLQYLMRRAEEGSIPENAPFAEVVGMAPRLGCGAGNSVVALSGAGDAYPCHLLMLPEFRADLSSLIDSPAEVRRQLKNDARGARGDYASKMCNRYLQLSPAWRLPGVESIPACEGCDVRYFCGGGCRAAAYAATGDIAGRDPSCESYRALISSLLWAWDDRIPVIFNLHQACHRLGFIPSS